MSDKGGWIKLHRKIRDCFLWNDKPYDKARAWIDLLLSAMHNDKKMLIDGKAVTVRQGSFMTSILKLADKWGWNQKTVRSYLKMLENEQMVTTNRTPKGTTVTIVNYERYQLDGTTDRTTERTTDGTTERTTERTTEGIQKKNIKNDKECKRNIYTCAFEDFWEVYPRKKDKGNAFKKFNARLNSGFSEVELIEAAKKYADECAKNHTEERYIKHPSTFLSDSTPFVDYLKKNNEGDDGTGRNGRNDKANINDPYADELERLLNGQ